VINAKHDAGAATQLPVENRSTKSHETSIPLSVNFEPRELNDATSKI